MLSQTSNLGLESALQALENNEEIKLWEVEIGLFIPENDPNTPFESHNIYVTAGDQEHAIDEAIILAEDNIAAVGGVAFAPCDKPNEVDCEKLKKSTCNSPCVTTGNGNQFNILEADIFKDYLTKAIDAVKSAAEDANVSPTGFEIDDAMCDCGEIETSDVADVIGEAAAHFGSYDSCNYKFIAGCLCEAVTEHFAKK